MSESAARAFKKILDPALDDFFEALEKKNIRGFVYSDAEHELPFELPHRVQGATLEAIPTADILEALDFSGELEGKGLPPRILSRHLLPFLEAYFSEQKNPISTKNCGDVSTGFSTRNTIGVRCRL